MSEGESFDVIKSFIGQICQRTLAADALKFSFIDHQVDGRGAYIWIEPPWAFLRDGKVVARSEECPEDTNAFRAWSERLAPLNQADLADAEWHEDGTLVLAFEGA